VLLLMLKCFLFESLGIFVTVVVSLFELQKLASIPTSAFYSTNHKHLAASLVRFCFFKVPSVCIITVTTHA